MYSVYGPLCTEVYDVSKPLGYSTGDVEYYIERLSDRKGSVLEIGCGSGRVLIPLMQAGIQMDGLDNSTAMLQSCRARCEVLNLKQPRLIQSEMHLFMLEQRYEAIIIPAGSFQLIENRENAIAALHHMFQHLLPGGKIMIDLFIPTASLHEHSTRTWETSNHEVLVLEDKKIEVDVLKQKMVSLLKYEKWREGRLVETELQKLPLSWYGYDEFVLLLERSGFQGISRSADYVYGQQASSAGQMITYEACK